MKKLFVPVLLMLIAGTVILAETTEMIGAEHLLAKRAVNAVLNLFAAVVCGTVAHSSLRLVRLEYLDGAVAFGAVPTWTLESIIPLSFGVMALRYFVLMLTEVKQWQS